MLKIQGNKILFVGILANKVVVLQVVSILLVENERVMLKLLIIAFQYNFMNSSKLSELGFQICNPVGIIELQI